MRSFFQNKPLLIAAAAIVLLLILVLASSGERTLTWAESAVGSVVQPVQSFAARASGSIIDFVENLFNTTDAHQENAQLKVYVAQLEQNVLEMETLRQENARLKALLDFTESTPDLTYVSGEVIGRSQGLWFDTFSINIGRNEGVTKNMPVVNGKGLVGRVSEVGATWSKVISVIDASMNVSVMIERTRDTGMVRGTLAAGTQSDLLELYYMGSDADIQPGDRVVTTVIGGIYPKGLTVGTVLEVSRLGESDYNAIIQPSVDFKRLEEIMVIVGMPQSEETP